MRFTLSMLAATATTPAVPLYVASPPTPGRSTYPGATHAFNVPGPDRTFFGEPMRFDQDAAADSAVKLTAFLGQYLKPDHRMAEALRAFESILDRSIA